MATAANWRTQFCVTGTHPHCPGQVANGRKGLLTCNCECHLVCPTCHQPFSGRVA